MYCTTKINDENLFRSILFLIYHKTSYNKRSAWLHNTILADLPRGMRVSPRSWRSLSLQEFELAEENESISSLPFSRRIFRVRCREKLLNEAAPHERKVETLQWVKERRRLSLPLDMSSSRERPPPESRSFFSFSCVFPSPP